MVTAMWAITKPWHVEVLVVIAGLSLSGAVILLARDLGCFRGVETVTDVGIRLVVLLAVPWAIPMYVGSRVMLLPHIRPFYQDSIFLTKSRQDRITWDVNDFYNYLSEVGFKIPPKTPSIGTTAGTSPSGVSIYPGVDVQTAIFIPENDVDDAALVERQYGNV